MGGDDTIAAISTPLGKGAIGIVRLSGTLALPIAHQLFSQSLSNIESHRVYYGWLQDPREHQRLDNILMIYMQAPRSYTGEDMVEFHCHGGPVLLKCVLDCCIYAGARLGERGEFSQRAFLNGKLDLTQTEAVLDLINGRSKESLFRASHQLDGHLSQPIRKVRRHLLNTLVAIEANIDFPDEVEPPAEVDIKWSLNKAIAEVERLLATADAGKIWRDGVRMAIVGKPNVGKSSLLNALLRYERAIVTEVPGTTRDTIEDEYNLNGIPVRVIDTAGLRDTSDQVEVLGIERSWAAIDKADLVLLVVDATVGISTEEMALLGKIGNRSVMVVFNKKDLIAERISFELPLSFVYTSACFADGIEELEQRLYEQISKSIDMDVPVAINQRHQACLWRAREALQRVFETVDIGLSTDFMAIDLKESISAMGEMIGESVTEEVIREIYQQFCIGK